MAITEIAVLYSKPIGKRGDVLQVRVVNTGAAEMIDVRKFYVDDADELRPTSKGIMLLPADWQAVIASLPLNGEVTTLPSKGERAPAKSRTTTTKGK